MKKQTIRHIAPEGRRVLVRVDFNVPLEKERGTISDDTRIRATLPTIRMLREKGARVILCSHLGRPKGRVVEALRLAPVASRLSELLGAPVKYVKDCIGPQVAQAVRDLAPGEVLLLENLRFYPEEEANDDCFAQALASLADIYVNDAFGACHRAHASVVGVARYLPAYAGLLLEQEVDMLNKVLYAPNRPLAAIIGGAKLSDKMMVVENLLERVDLLLLGGGMAATFLKAQGYAVGNSLVEEDRLSFTLDLLRESRSRGVPLMLPVDVVVARDFNHPEPRATVRVEEIPEGWCIVDVGPQTLALFKEKLKECHTIFWNGPMGIFEVPPFDRGTRDIAETLASLSQAITVVGGGSTAEAVEAWGLAPHMTHVSTGGGASLDFIAGKTLPGIAVLQDVRG